MNRALRPGDFVEFRDSVEAAEFCASSVYPMLRGLVGGSYKWDEAKGATMKVVARRDFVQVEAIQQGLFERASAVEPKRRKLSRPMLEVELSWHPGHILAWAADMRLDGRKRRNSIAAKIEEMKALRRRARRRRLK